MDVLSKHWRRICGSLGAHAIVGGTKSDCCIKNIIRDVIEIKLQLLYTL